MGTTFKGLLQVGDTLRKPLKCLKDYFKSLPLLTELVFEVEKEMRHLFTIIAGSSETILRKRLLWETRLAIN